MHSVVTGANRGIGLEYCRQLKELGHSVTALCRRSSDELDRLSVNIVEGVDVRKPPSLDHLEPIDWLVLNAGIWRDESITDMNFETILEQFEVNALGPLRIVTRVLGKLREGSKVVLMTSRMGCIGDNTSGGRYGYRMSKGALNCAAVSLSHDLRPRGIAVGILHPGYVSTDMTRHKGTISPGESVAAMIDLIDRLNLDTSGTLWDYRGDILPW